MKKNQSDQWVKDTQQVRNTTREARWCINDGSRTRLPVIDSGSASELSLHPVGQSSAAPQQHCIMTAYCSQRAA